MSEQLPKIYGTCPAGCRWETVHRSEFEKSASHIKQYMQDDGLYHLEVGKEYKAVEEQANDEFNACLSVELIYDGDISIKKLFDGVKNPDPFSNTFTFKVLGLSDVDGIISIVYEFCGVRYSESVDIVEEITGVCLDWGGELYLYNSDATIIAKSAYDIAVEHGFEGTEQEWLASITKGANGKSAYEYAKDGGYAKSEEDFAEDINPDNINQNAEDFIITELAKRGQSSPQFANDVSECTDTSKLYVLPNGNIWAYTKELVENKVNQYNPNTAKFNYRVHPSYIGTENDPWRVCKGLVHVEINGLDFTNKKSYIIRISGVTPVRHSAMGITGQAVFLNQPSSAPWDFTGYKSDKYIDSNVAFSFVQDDNGYYVDLMVANPAADTTRCYLGICLADNTNISAADCENLFIEAVPLTTYTEEYSWRDTGLAYANYVLTDKDTTIIAEKVDKKINSIMYVDGDTGNDANTGNQDNPLKTIQKAIDSGAKTIYCRVGTYNENITLNNIHGVKIIGQWEEYESGKRPKVRIDHSTELTPTDNGNGLKTIDLPSDLYKYEHPLLYNVFVTKQYQPTMGSGVTIGYVVSLWNVTDEQISTHYKLVPVMTLEECQSTEETFFYDGTTLYIHSVGSTFKMVSSSKRNIVENCSDVVFEDIAFDYCYYDALAVNNSNGVIFRNCEFSHSSTACGIATNNMNGEFYNCEAYRNRIDGFNLHKFGETTVYNCIGAYNYDDGISHHEGCTGSIHGGQYHHNGKGGVSSPTYGAEIDIYNVISHNNQYGIYAVSGTADRQIIVNGCYIHHNTYGVVSPQYELLVIHSTLTDNSTNTSGNVTVIN